MSDQDKPVPAPDSVTAEAQMRRALGLQGPARPVQQQRPDQARARHRFVQDGGVPVVVLNRSDIDPTGPLKTRITELEAALETERAAHGATKRLLQDAHAAQQALQTRMAHSEIAHREALAAESTARHAADARVQAVSVAAPPKASKTRKAAVRTQAPQGQEAQPVKWWLPGYRTKAK
jgi:hypothetical protein